MHSKTELQSFFWHEIWGNQKWDDWVHKLIKETDFGTLEYEAKWNERRKKKKKNDALGSRPLKK